MQRRIILSVLILAISCANVAFAATGYFCDNQIDIITQGQLDDPLALNGKANLTFRAYPVDSSNGAGNNIAPVGDLARPCRNYTLSNQQNNYLYWFKWRPAQDVAAAIFLDDVNRNQPWNTKIMWFAQKPGTLDCSNYENGDLDPEVSWGCQAYINNMCQNYPESTKASYFKATSEYVFLLGTNNDLPVGSISNPDVFFVNFVKASSIALETFETATVGKVPPAGWSINTTATYRSWFVGSNSDGEADPYFTPSTIDLLYVGNSLGSKYIMLSPTRNDPYNATTCHPNGWTGPGAQCDHTYDILSSPNYNLAAYTHPYLSFDNYWYSGALSVSGTIYHETYVEVSGGAVVKRFNVTDNQAFWLKQTIDLTPWAGMNAVTIRFVFKILNDFPPRYGWLLNDIGVWPGVTYDMCDDGFACTDATCSLTSHGCSITPSTTYCGSVSVPCLDNVCDPSDPGADSTGCVYTNRTGACEDYRSCTDDYCNPATGCVHVAHVERCDDGKGCTKDFCYTNDTDVDNLGGVGTGCYFRVDCDDNVACTIDRCVNVTGNRDRCLHTVDNLLCEDYVDCTYELACDAENPGYSNTPGCIKIPMHEWCDDHDPCTIDTCEPELGSKDSCVHTNMTCDDCIDCTVDSCTDGDCDNDAVDELCDDHYDCTVDVCDKSLGKCVNSPNDTYCAYFGSLCHVHYCRPWASTDGSGCVSFPKDCDDDLACSDDGCDELTGDCIFTANDTACDDGLECTDDVCNQELGKCSNIPNSMWCNDFDNCTVDFCNGESGMCDSFELDCSDEIKCTMDYCRPDTGCVHDPVHEHCNDTYDCTMDSCDVHLGKCVNAPSHAYCESIGDLCHTHYCNPESTQSHTGCYSVIKDCNDGISCTIDYCNSTDGECYHTANHTLCDDGFNCTEDTCDKEMGQCTNVPIDAWCNDTNLCTLDSCGCDGECHHVPTDCNDQIYCTDDWCDELTGRCHHDQNDTVCDDGIDCTHDYCDVRLGRCVNIERDLECPGRSECETGKCSIEHDGCIYKSHDWKCDDLIGCTVDTCYGPFGCSNHAHDSLCDDGIECTENICNVTLLRCDYPVHNEWCDDSVACTDDTCNPTKGCEHTKIPSFCNDNINCTYDYCDLRQDCQYVPVHHWCSDGLGCTRDICDPTDPHGDWCSWEAIDSRCDHEHGCGSHKCDFDDGCVYNYTGCPFYQLGSDDKTCIECMSSSGQINQWNYKDGSGAMEFTVRDNNGVMNSNLYLMPSGPVVVGSSNIAAVPVAKTDGLVVTDNFKIAPLQRGVGRAECNEVRRGTIVIEEEFYPCADTTCFRDVMYLCVKLQEYQWVTLSNTQ